MIDWPRFVELVGGHQRFLLVSHVRPDCDAVGSELALAGMLEQLGKDVWIVNGFAVPPNLRFLDPQRKLKQLGVDVPAGQLDDREVIVVLDTTAWVQLGAMAEVIRTSKARKLVIDHHVSEDDLGAELFKDGEAEATGRLVLEAGEALGVRLTPEIAQPLFAAIATDTGWFRFASTGAETFRAAARLLEAGAQPDRLFKDLYETETLARLQLTGRTLARTQTELGGRLIYTWVERGDFEATGAVPSDTEDLINMTLTVGGTEVARDPGRDAKRLQGQLPQPLRAGLQPHCRAVRRRRTSPRRRRTVAGAAGHRPGEGFGGGAGGDGGEEGLGTGAPCEAWS